MFVYTIYIYTYIHIYLSVFASIAGILKLATELHIGAGCGRTSMYRQCYMDCSQSKNDHTQVIHSKATCTHQPIANLRTRDFALLLNSYPT